MVMYVNVEPPRVLMVPVDKQWSTSTLNTKKSKPSRSSSEEKEAKNKKGLQQQAKTNHVPKGKRSGLELLAADEIVLKPPKKLCKDTKFTKYIVSIWKYIILYCAMFALFV